MAGLDNILELISARQHEAESAVISAAQRKAESIAAAGNSAAQKEYDEYMKKARFRLEQELINSKTSIDSDMKRKQLAYKVKEVDNVIEKTLKKLNDLPTGEYFAILEKLLRRRVQKGNGVLYLCERDLGRITEDFKKSVSDIAEKVGGTVKISEKAADVDNGFVLTYGLISENCSFRDIIGAERDAVRDTAAKALFGQVT